MVHVEISHTVDTAEALALYKARENKVDIDRIVGHAVDACEAHACHEGNPGFCGGNFVWAAGGNKRNKSLEQHTCARSLVREKSVN